MMPRHLIQDGWTIARIDSPGARGRAFPASVPGCALADLARSGEIPDPLYADNARFVAEAAGGRWGYRVEFSLPPEHVSRRAERIDLVCEGLDAYAEISLNGKLLGASQNLFLPWRAGIDNLHEVNVLEIIFDPPLARAGSRASELGLDANDSRSLAVVARKMALAWGHDYIPALPSCGIWNGCRIEWLTGGRILDVAGQATRLDDAGASIDVYINLELFTNEETLVSVSMEWEGKRVASTEIHAAGGPGKQQVRTTLQVADPRPWHPNGQGESALYDLKVELRADGEAVDRSESRLGLRTLEWRLGGGDRPGLLVNGSPIFLQGFHWLPIQLFPSLENESRTTRALEGLAKTGANIVRVWCGGMYESPAFYDACDRLGLLVWQEFPFPSGWADSDEGSLEEIAAEAAHQIRRLRGRASLAIWSAPAPRSPANDAKCDLHRSILAAQLEALDPGRPRFMRAEDAALETRLPPGWDVDAVLPEDGAPLIGEAGLIALPHLKTVERYLPLDSHQIDARMLAERCEGGRDEGLPRIARYVSHYNALPVRFDEWIYKSQLAQAERCREIVESSRMREGGAGVILWAWNDPFFGATRSAIDVAGRPKALAHLARGFFSPLQIVFRPGRAPAGALPERLEIHLLNGGRASFAGDLAIEHWSLDGRLKSERTASVSIAAGSTTRTETLRPARFRPDLETDFLSARLMAGDTEAARALWFFLPPKFLRFPRIDVSWEASTEGDREFAIRLETPHVALWVSLESIRRSDVEFEDNFFHVFPGKPRVVRARTMEPVALEEFRRDLSVRYLHDRPSFENQKPQGHTRG